MASKGKGKGKIKSKKKARLHDLDKLRFKTRAQEKMYDKLAEEFVSNHLPKIMYIVPQEVREKDGEDFNAPGKLFKEEIETINTNKTYVKKARTYIKWHVINKGIRSLADIDRESNDEFFEVISRNIGVEKDEYSKRTYDGYIDATYKMFTALAKEPEDAKVQLEGREFAPSLSSARQLLSMKYKEALRNKVDAYSKKEYKRGTGYTSSQASTIMRAAEKNLDTKEQFLVALLVHGGLRNDEAQQFSLDCLNSSRGSLDLLKKGMTKQDRGRVVLNAHPQLFDLAEKLKEEGVSVTTNLFANYDSTGVREVVKNCCTHGKIKYSGVHDLRKAYVEKIERELYSAIKKGKTTKDDLVNNIMNQVSAKPSLNPLVAVKVKHYRTVKGKRVPYWTKKTENGEVVKERKFTIEKLQKMNIEDLADLFVAEQLGHSDPETTYEYRSEKAAEKRRAFRFFEKKKRKKEESK